MKVYQIFPFEYVEKDSRIMIYGLGKYGLSYIEQVQATQWCKIVGVSDIDSSKNRWGYPFFAIDELKGVEADYIIIAISATNMVAEVYQQLLEQGVPDEKIVSTLIRSGENYKCMPQAVHKSDSLQILLQFGGGLGDCVVCLSAYEKIIGMLQKAEIDIQCRGNYGKALLDNKAFLRTIIDVTEKTDYDAYDLVLRLDHSIAVLRYDEFRCEKYAPELNEKIQMLIATSKYVRNDIKGTGERFSIQIRMAVIKAWNRYFALGHGEVLGLTADMVHIELAERYQDEYRKLKLGKFLTLNRGADMMSKYKTMQTKVWPLKYYEDLVRIIKDKYPKYEIVQLGGKDTEQIEGVDRYIKGQNFELVKYILKGSTLHFDCEGGLVHLATALGTKCAVVFGPTPIEYYGYQQNINITAGKCHNCMHLTEDWYVKCLKEQNEPECMYGITPEMVFWKISEYLGKVEMEEQA